MSPRCLVRAVVLATPRAPREATAYSVLAHEAMEADHAALIEKGQIVSTSMTRNADIFVWKLLSAIRTRTPPEPR